MSLTRLRYRSKQHFPVWVDIIGWIMLGIIVGVVPVFAVKAIYNAQSTGIIGRVREALEPEQELEQPMDFWEPKPLVVINNPKDALGHQASVMKNSRGFRRGPYDKNVYQGETII